MINPTGQNNPLFNCLRVWYELLAGREYCQWGVQQLSHMMQEQIEDDEQVLHQYPHTPKRRYMQIQQDQDYEQNRFKTRRQQPLPVNRFLRKEQHKKEKKIIVKPQERDEISNCLQQHLALGIRCKDQKNERLNYRAIEQYISLTYNLEPVYTNYTKGTGNTILSKNSNREEITRLIQGINVGEAYLQLRLLDPEELEQFLAKDGKHFLGVFRKRLAIKAKKKQYHTHWTVPIKKIQGIYRDILQNAKLQDYLQQPQNSIIIQLLKHVDLEAYKKLQQVYVGMYQQQKVFIAVYGTEGKPIDLNACMSVLSQRYGKKEE